MNKLIAALLVVVVLAAAAAAQTPKPFNFYLGAGVSPLSGDFGNVWKMGFHGSFGFGINVAPGFQIVPKVEYHSFPLDTKGTSVTGGTLSSFMFGGDARYEFGLPAAPVKPVILGGLGMARASVSDLSNGYTAITFGSETKVYFEFGGGVVFNVGPSAKLFVTVRYTSVALEGTSLNYIPITVGVIL